MNRTYSDADVPVRIPPYIIEEEFDTDAAKALADTIPEHVALKDAMSVGELFRWGAGVKVSVLDTGISRHHAERGDLQEAYGRGKHKSFVGGSHFGSNGHGEHCAGIICADEDSTGTLGLAHKCDLYVGKVLSDSGGGSSSGIAAGINWAAQDHGCDIVSMSLGGGYSRQSHEACQRANASGTLVIAAAGNSGNGGVDYPGHNDDSVLAVAAIDFEDQIASFSSRGKSVDWSDYGVRVYSTYRSGYARLSGTSMATPNFAATVAAVMGLEIAITGKRVTGIEGNTLEAFKALFARFTIDLGSEGHDNAYGNGKINFPVMITTLANELATDPTDPVEPPPDEYKITITGTGPVTINKTDPPPVFT